MLEDGIARLTVVGSVVIDAGSQYRVRVSGFDGEGLSCRDVAALGMLWAIGELQRELMKTLEQPGGGSCAVD